MKWKPIDDSKEDKKSSEMIWTELASKVDENEGQTVFHCRYVSKLFYANGGWVNIDGDTYLENADTFEQLELLNAIGIPYAPFRHYFKNAGEIKNFSLIFPKIPKYWKTFHLVERAGSGSFRVRDIMRNDLGVYHIELT
jgi:hypothetical protein